MDHRTTLRALAEAVEPGQAVSVPASWLLAALRDGDPEPPPALEVDLTVPQLAARFGKAPSTVRGWLEAGEFSGAYRRRGREWRVPRAAVEAYQDRQRAAAPAPTEGAANLGTWRSHLPRPAA